MCDLRSSPSASRAAASVHVEEVLTSTREGRQEMTEHERCHQLRQNFSADKLTNLA